MTPLSNLKIPSTIFLLIAFSNINKKHTNESQNTSFHTYNNNSKENNPHKNHRKITIRIKNHYTNNFHKNHYTNNFVAINQINKHKAKIYNHCMYTQIIIKKCSSSHKYKTNFLFVKYKNGKFIVKFIVK